MKTRIASSIALAAAILLGASGCALFAPQGTLDQYAPSDGIDLTVDDVHLRNVMLVAASDGQNFNVVFTGVNNGDSTAPLTISFVSEDGSAEASADFSVEPGSTLFGDPEGEVPPTLVSIPNLAAGATVTAYFQVPGSTDVERQVPVLDGTLAEYQQFVLSAPVEVMPVDDSVMTDEAETTDPEAAEDETAE